MTPRSLLLIRLQSQLRQRYPFKSHREKQANNIGSQAWKYSVGSLQFFMMCLLWLSPVPGAYIVLFF